MREHREIKMEEIRTVSEKIEQADMILVGIGEKFVSGESERELEDA